MPGVVTLTAGALPAVVEEVAEGFDVAFGFVGVFAPGVDSVVVDIDAGNAGIEGVTGDVVFDGFGECGDIVVVFDDRHVDFCVGLPDTESFDHLQIFELRAGLVAVAVAAQCGVELVDVINRAGFRQLGVNNGVDECFGRRAMRRFADRCRIKIADEKIGGLELAFVFSAGGDEKFLWI